MLTRFGFTPEVLLYLVTRAMGASSKDELYQKVSPENINKNSAKKFVWFVDLGVTHN